MKISNFQFKKLNGERYSEWKAFGTIEIKRLLRKSETVEIFSNVPGLNWFFVETGKLTPYSVNDLVRSWEAKNGDIFTKERQTQ